MIVLVGRRSRTLSGVEFCNLVLGEGLAASAVEHEWIELSASAADARGSVSAASLARLATGTTRLLRLSLARRGVTVYLPLSQGGYGLLRDVALCLLARLHPRNRLAVHLHGEFRAELAATAPRRLLRRAAYRLVGRLATRVISCVSGHVFAGRATTYVSNVGLLPAIQAERPAVNADERPAGAPRVGCLGLVAPGKGAQTLVRACAAAAVEVRLVGPVARRADALAGAADVDAFTAELAAAHVTTTGPLIGADKWHELATWAVACFPSRSEGLPLSVLEARLLGVPVVASAVGDLPTLAAGDPGTVMVPPGDEAALRRALDAVLAGPARRELPPALVGEADYARELTATLEDV